MRKTIMLSVTICLISFEAAPAGFEIEVGRNGPKDDYVCWGNVDARVRWSGPAPAPQKVKLSSQPTNAAGSSGTLAFADPADATLTRKQELIIPLRAGGEWTHFYISGTSASTADKDVSITAEEESTNAKAVHPVMVRVRKNAEKLTDAERDRFLTSFVKAAQRNNQFDVFWRLHSDGVTLAHQYAFLPWHRTLLIHFERLLQSEDPSVALPYWEFDKPAKRLFSKDFIGVVGEQPNLTIVQYSGSNPISRWRGLSDPRVRPLTRESNGDTQTSPDLNKNFMLINDQITMSSQIFGPYHGAAHCFIGGLICNLQRSPGDPLFFLLHANVDRAWAAWQRFHDRFDRHKREAYGLQGAKPAGSNIRAGNYEKDTMWPWDNTERPTDPVVETIGSVTLPPNLGPGNGLIDNPEVGETLDYLDLSRKDLNQNFCYDNIPIGIGKVPDFWTSN